MNRATIAEWNFDTNVTEANKQTLAEARNAVYDIEIFNSKMAASSYDVHKLLIGAFKCDVH